MVQLDTSSSTWMISFLLRTQTLNWTGLSLGVRSRQFQRPYVPGGLHHRHPQALRHSRVEESAQSLLSKVPEAPDFWTWLRAGG
mmetsp:Transcript_22404/g.32213  ORF Transcript_22404/g.32213 Transcript_22404/m.32213 type:complete len:84 (-) Transcript_22404:1069-1320(-)